MFGDLELNRTLDAMASRSREMLFEIVRVGVMTIGLLRLLFIA
jgi:hypothetical protein